MKPGTLIINEKKFEYKFNHKARRLFMEANGMEYFADYVEAIKDIQPHPVKGMSLKGISVMAEIIICAIKGCQEFDEFDKDGFVDYLLDDQNEMERIMNEFTQNQEQEPKQTKNAQRSRAKKS